MGKSHAQDFAQEPNEMTINYRQLSKNMGLQRNALDLMHSSLDMDEERNGQMSNKLSPRQIMSTLRRKNHSQVRLAKLGSGMNLSMQVDPQQTLQLNKDLVTPQVRTGRLFVPLSTQSSKVQQVNDLCVIIDKEKTGRVKIADFMRILKTFGLQLSNSDLMKHTNEAENFVEFRNLTRELLEQSPVQN